MYEREREFRISRFPVGFHHTEVNNADEKSDDIFFWEKIYV